MRALDDGIVHALNTAIPSASFASKVDAPSECKRLFEKVRIRECFCKLIFKREYD